MAVAWAKKLGTEYVEDPVFVKNFFEDFSAKIGSEKLDPSSIDFSEVLRFVDKEREYKASLPRDEKKEAARERKALREKNKELYGYAYVDGIRTEVGNYVAEPSSIFMGRGKHPIRGKWKEGPRDEDIELNLSRDAPKPLGDWKARVWEPESMWIARWRDRLSNKMKYVWLSDFAVLKQKREMEKFNTAKSLDQRLEEVRAHIEKNLVSPDLTRRRIASVCYLVDNLMFRVGDEENEAGTVGASTLKPEHISFNTDGSTTFDFLGKDSIRFKRTLSLPPAVISNLRQFMQKSHSAIFKGVRSKPVSDFLGEVMPGLTAKVFRTYHATRAVDDYLKGVDSDNSDPDHVKKHTAVMANLQAAILCNHKRKIPKNWRNTLEKKQDRLRKLRSQEKKTPGTLQALEKLKLNIEETKETRDCNLRTSLKSYIDPRTYYNWGLRINYDWKTYYPKTLQKKFSWVENNSPDDEKR